MNLGKYLEHAAKERLRREEGLTPFVFDEYIICLRLLNGKEDRMIEVDERVATEEDTDCYVFRGAG